MREKNWFWVKLTFCTLFAVLVMLVFHYYVTPYMPKPTFWQTIECLIWQTEGDVFASMSKQDLEWNLENNRCIFREYPICNSLEFKNCSVVKEGRGCKILTYSECIDDCTFGDTKCFGKCEKLFRELDYYPYYFDCQECRSSLTKEEMEC